MSDNYHYSSSNYNYQAQQYQHTNHPQMESNNFHYNSRFNQPMNYFDQRSRFPRPRYYSNTRPEYSRSRPYPRYRNSSQYHRRGHWRDQENEGKNNIERYYQPSMVEDPWLEFEQTKADDSSTTEETK